MREKVRKIDLNKNNSEVLTLADALGMEDAFPKTSQGEETSFHSENVSQKDKLPEKLQIRLSLERKGRSGKTVTVLSGLSPRDPNVHELIKSLKRDLGCGATVEDTLIFFQGDQRQRLYQCLVKQSFLHVKVI